MKTRITFINIFIFLIFIFCRTEFSNCQNSPQYNFDDIRSIIKSSIKSSKTPSISVAVAKDGKIILEESFGWANREKQIKATP